VNVVDHDSVVDEQIGACFIRMVANLDGLFCVAVAIPMGYGLCVLPSHRSYQYLFLFLFHRSRSPRPFESLSFLC
jgi:hypothetical protein